MGTRNLDKIFEPQRIAVIGASDERPKVGWTVLRNLIGAGFGGVVYPVNSKREAVQGIQAHPNVAALPRPADLAVICTPAPTVPGLIRECGEAGIMGIVILTAGFRETGSVGREIEDQIRAEWRKFDGMRIVGPNCLGVIAPHVHLNASFAADSPAPGHIALISQSGALCTSLLDWAAGQNVGFSYFVSIGNMLDVSFGDLIDYFGEDPMTKSAILYVESVPEARSFMSAARAFSRTRPLVAYKAGRFAESAHAAASHTGAMAGEDAVCDAAFKRAGIERRKKFIGVGRLVADANHDTAEFALLVADAWQNHGLGLRLTDHCLDIARRWEVKRIIAETSLDNPRMIGIFEQRGFRVERRLEDRVVAVEMALWPQA